MLQYLENLVVDFEESDLDRQLNPGMNPPRWILGHLAINTDYGLRAFGRRFQCPIDWHRSYARGTNPDSHPEQIPTKVVLINRISEGFSELRNLCPTADPQAMSQPHAVPFLKETPIQTVGEILSHLMTTHLSFHMGQLSFWRRATGRPRIEPGTSA